MARQTKPSRGSAAATQAARCEPPPVRSDLKLPVLPADKPRVRPSRAGKWRAYSLLSVHVFMIAHFVQWMLAGETISPVEPSESMETITSGKINAGFIFFAVALLATLILGRWVCGWGCHLIAYQDLTLWVLKKLRLRPKPFATRLFWLVPLTAAIYMFVWPELVRLYIGADRPPTTWHVTTTGFWDTFPQYGIAILTVLSCGVAIIYFLGPKGFCTFACPYGAFFGLTDKLAVGRIRVTDACHECGHCTSVCTSNVRVAEEVKLYKMVVDPGCMKCMDCVTVCPNDALYFGFGPPSLGRQPIAPPAKRRFDLTLAEEIFALIVFLGVFLAYRGLYGRVPFLMSLGIAGVGAFLIMKAIRIAYAPDVLIQRTRLKIGGRLQPLGTAFLVAVFVLVVFTVHSGIWRFHDWQGQRAFSHSPPETFRWQYDPAGPPGSRDPHRAGVDTAIHHLEFCKRWGLYPTPENDLQRAWLYVCADRLKKAAECVQAALDRNPEDFSTWMNLAKVLTAAGELADARSAFERALKLETTQREKWARKVTDNPLNGSARLWTEWGMFLAHMGEADAALTALKFACNYDPQFADGQLALGDHRLRMDNPDAARKAFIAAVMIAPQRPEAYEALRIINKSQQHYDRAVTEYRTAIKDRPDISSLRNNLAYALSELNRYQEAAAEYREALRLAPGAWATRADYGALLLILGDATGAIEQYRQIVGAEPQNAEALLRLGYLFIQTGNYKAAKPLVEAALQFGDEAQRATARMLIEELTRRTAPQGAQP